MASKTRAEMEAHAFADGTPWTCPDGKTEVLIWPASLKQLREIRKKYAELSRIQTEGGDDIGQSIDIILACTNLATEEAVYGLPGSSKDGSFSMKDMNALMTVIFELNYGIVREAEDFSPPPSPPS